MSDPQLSAEVLPRRFALLVILVTVLDEAEPLILLQRKGFDHPNPDYRGRLTLWGGSGTGELVHEILERRLKIQFGETACQGFLLSSAVPSRVSKLEMHDHAGALEMNVSLVQLSLESLQYFAFDLFLPAEGFSALLRLSEVRMLLQDETNFLPEVPRLLALALPKFNFER